MRANNDPAVYFIYRVRLYLEAHAGKRRELRRFVSQKTGVLVDNAQVTRWIHGDILPRASVFLMLLRWMQLEDQIKPVEKSIGLFRYTHPLHRRT